MATILFKNQQTELEKESNRLHIMSPMSNLIKYNVYVQGFILNWTELVAVSGQPGSLRVGNQNLKVQLLTE